MIKNGKQHCISVMRAIVLNIKLMIINKLTAKPKVSANKSRTTLILNRCMPFEKIQEF